MFDFSKAKEQFSEAAEHLKNEYMQISTGRANPALLDSVKVDSYGTLQPIRNIASINTDDARTLRITPWDKSQLKGIEKAIIDSKLPFSISVGDTSVIINIPQLTEEGKKSLVKLIKEKLESARVHIRSIRQETLKAIDEAEARGDFAEDDKKRFKDELQKMVDKANEELETIFKEKEKDIMSV